MDRTSPRPVLSIVVPAYNEEDVLEQFHSRLSRVLDRMQLDAEIIFVNDGSKDRTLVMMRKLNSQDPRVGVVNLSRNFGKEIAMTAGLDHVRGQAAIVIDADLQDPPELIPALVEKWREGFDAVYARRRERHGETTAKRATARLFYRLIGRLADVDIPQDTGDFRLLNRRCLDALAACREQRRFMKGLFAWVGFKQTEVLYDRDPRYAGETKWNYWRLCNFAVEGITSFTIAPLRLATYLGLLTAAVAFLYAGYIVAHTVLFGRDIPGYASLMAVILLLGGVQLIAMGVIGEYVGRIYVEAKGRPLYVLDSYLYPRSAPQAPENSPRHHRHEFGAHRVAKHLRAG